MHCRQALLPGTLIGLALTVTGCASSPGKLSVDLSWIKGVRKDLSVYFPSPSLRSRPSPTTVIWQRKRWLVSTRPIVGVYRVPVAENRVIAKYRAAK